MQSPRPVCRRSAFGSLLLCLSSLLLCGIMAVMLEHYDEAEVFFEDATCLEPSNILAWTILGRGSAGVMAPRADW